MSGDLHADARPAGDHQRRLVAAAQSGDAAAVEQLIESVRDRIYRLSLRMVTQRADAEDATQEILIKILTRLSTFRGDAQFSTWAHRVAVHHLLDRKKTAVERLEMTFEMYGDDLRTGLSPTTVAGADVELLATEVRLACTQAMLTCLDRDHRVAYVLGEVFELSSAEAADICGVPAATYRKRLSRARDRVRSFLGENCGLVNPEATPCRCERRIDTAVALGRIDPTRPELALHPVIGRSSTNASAATEQMERLFDAASLMRSHPEYIAPATVTDRISALVNSGEFEFLADRTVQVENPTTRRPQSSV